MFLGQVCSSFTSRSLLLKMKPNPVMQCCCGCSLDVGVLVILGLNFALNVWLVVAAAGDIIGKDPTFSYSGSDLIVETIVAAFALAGIPITIAGIWGTIYKDKNLVLLYWYYAALSFGFSIWWLVVEVIINSPCQKISSMENRTGKAYSCGLSKVFSAFVSIIWLLLPMYLLFVVYSYIVQLEYCTSGAAFSDLTASKVKVLKSWPRKNDQNYGTYAENFVDSTKMFGGDYHDVEYPPIRVNPEHNSW